MRGAGRWSRATAGAVVAGCDVLAWRLRGQAARVAVRSGGAVAVLGIARGAGLSWTELGLGRAELKRGFVFGMAAGACAAAAMCAAVALPATRGLFLDERAAAASPGRLPAELARITFAAVPPEELTYRSALLGLAVASAPVASTTVAGAPVASAPVAGASVASAVAWSSLLFGLSHIPPTLATMSKTAMHGHIADRPLRTGAFVAGNVAVTGLAGAVFAWLRLRSGSVVAPLIAHAAVNDAALAAARAAHELAAASRR
ncbi:MAG TPA: CPBP family glutamic-type intramembrane protease [Streptosporangiaceae bacterium]